MISFIFGAAKIDVYDSDSGRLLGTIYDTSEPQATICAPLDLLLYCPSCHLQHIDAPDARTPDWTNPPHKSHLCHGCGCIWRPADVPTNGVESIKTRGKDDTYTAPAFASWRLPGCLCPADAKPALRCDSVWTRCEGRLRILRKKPVRS